MAIWMILARKLDVTKIGVAIIGFYDRRFGTYEETHFIDPTDDFRPECARGDGCWWRQ